MPAEFKDYYATLGVARDATDDDIKKAFRSLARRYHPDVAKDKKTAEEKFKEINEANEVLSDPAKRKRYDELGARWGEESRAEPPPGPQARGTRSSYGGPPPKFHFTGTGFSDFFEQFFGAGSRYGFESEGRDFGTGSSVEERRGADVEGEILVTLQEVMGGTIRQISLRTADPRTGETETHSFQVRIPAGAIEGRRIRVPGKGEAGDGGAPAGDLYLRVRYAAHPDFRVRGADLYYDADLAPWEAVLGSTIVVPSFEGPIKVRIPPATNTGAQLRVRGHGLPRGQSAERGDLFVVAGIQVPPQLTDREKTLWEELRKTSRFNPREPS
jgi:curved DNA-binding protein